MSAVSSPPFPRCLIAECAPCHHRNLQRASPHVHSTPWLQRNLGLPKTGAREDCRLIQWKHTAITLEQCTVAQFWKSLKRIEFFEVFLREGNQVLQAWILYKDCAKPFQRCDSKNHWLKQTETTRDQMLLYQPPLSYWYQAASDVSQFPKSKVPVGIRERLPLCTLRNSWLHDSPRRWLSPNPSFPIIISCSDRNIR